MSALHDYPDPVPKGRKVKDTLELAQLQAMCCRLCQWENKSFPGSQPVSLGRQQLPELTNEPYYACEKSDGVRYLLLVVYNNKLDKSDCFMVDRKFGIVQVEMTFPFIDAKSGKELLHHGTLLDGELVDDRRDGKVTQRFMVFDCMSVHNRIVGDYSLDRRLQYFHDHVLEPRRLSSRVQLDKEAFELRMKPMYRAQDVDYIFKSILPNLDHGNDGIIFTPVNPKYFPGTCNKLLKWKPAELNTVDLEVGVEYRSREPHFVLNACRDTVTAFYDWLSMTDEDYERFCGEKGHNAIRGKIVECLYDSNLRTFIPDSAADSWEKGTWRNGGWRLLRLREDKKLANDVKTIEKVMITVRDNLGKDELVERLTAKGDIPNVLRGVKRARSDGDTLE